MRLMRFAVLCALVVFTAACNGEPNEPSTLPDVTPTATAPSPTPNPTPTVEPPVEPPNAHDYSEEGVEAFTRYAIDVINYAYQTNDVTYLEQIMTPDCQTCSNTIERLSTIGAAGGRVEGGQMIASEISVVGPAEGIQTSAGVDLVVTGSKTIDSAGEVRNSESDRQRYYIFNLTWEEQAWKLDEILRPEDSPA
jgi:Family of unknown function (DUF6318)